ncbi:DUF3221 domain-containing protein [Domibacillus robiginosus]|uniref:DUF3221 domain-containing protein n=1 Tax=Domibacillus robiginosus TaxID=1071054 RepID=UPI00067D3C49|nr:DUF3221 domain-containing protein [Domibacillus robiginosus]
MKTAYIFFLSIITVLCLLAACSNEKNKATSSTDSDKQTLEKFQGHVVEKGFQDDGREKVLIVKGITEEDALKASYDSVAKNENHENIVWFINDQNYFQEIKKGEKVNVWWNTKQATTLPSILTVEAEKVEVVQKLEQAALKEKTESNEDLSTTTGYIQSKNTTSIWITSKPGDKKNGTIFDIAAIDKNKTSALKTGQKVQVTHYSDLMYTNPAQGTAVEIELLEEGNAVVQGYIVRKDEGTIRVMDQITKEEIVGKSHEGLEAYLRKQYDSEGYSIGLEVIDEKTKSSLQIGQKVTVTMDWVFFTSPLSGTALEIKIEEK